jgi:hypothetical protein
MYATNKYPLWLVPDVYILISKHAFKNWEVDCLKRAHGIKRVMVWETCAHLFPGSEPIAVDYNALWFDRDTYGGGAGSLFPLIQQAVLDGADELVLVGIDGFVGDTCANKENHYDKDYFVGCVRTPDSQKTNDYLIAGHREASKRCKELGVKVTVLGNSMFKAYYKEN